MASFLATCSASIGVLYPLPAALYTPSGVGRHLVPGTPDPAEPVERSVALPGDRVRLRALLGREVAVDGAERREVAAQRTRQQTLLVAAHRGRPDQLVVRLPALRERHRALALERARAGAPVPQARGLARLLDLPRRTER